MRVKIGDQTLDSIEQPIIVEFDPHELEVAKTLDEKFSAIYSYPEGSNLTEIESWVDERINEGFVEEPDDAQVIPLHEGNTN